MTDIYPTLLRLLSRFDPERVHNATLRVTQLAGAVPPIGALARRLWGPAADPVEVFGLGFPNRVGIAAGFDKDGIAWRGLSRLGVGHIEVGTVTPDPQPGNPKPRVFRLLEDTAVVNRMGFPSRGADYVADRLSRRRPGSTVIGVNIGKAAGTPVQDAVDDYLLLLERFVPMADYLTVNVSSPNTPGLRSLQAGDRLAKLLGCLVARRDKLTPYRPLLVKLAPDLGPDELAAATGAALEVGIDGIVATNTTVERTGTQSPLAVEEGGLSGEPLKPAALATLQLIVDLASGTLPVVASGGVMSRADARARLAAGASLVQVYTGLVYTGPALMRQIGIP